MQGKNNPPNLIKSMIRKIATNQQPPLKNKESELELKYM